MTAILSPTNSRFVALMAASAVSSPVWDRRYAQECQAGLVGRARASQIGKDRPIISIIPWLTEDDPAGTVATAERILRTETTPSEEPLHHNPGN